jgi:hypothetical protein
VNGREVFSFMGKIEGDIYMLVWKLGIYDGDGMGRGMRRR